MLVCLVTENSHNNSNIKNKKQSSFLSTRRKNKRERKKNKTKKNRPEAVGRSSSLVTPFPRQDTSGKRKAS